MQNELEEAAAQIKTLSEKPDNETLLKLYSLYKQAISCDVSSEKPGMFDFIALAKHNAWSELKGMTSETASKEYIKLVEKLTSK